MELLWWICYVEGYYFILIKYRQITFPEDFTTSSSYNTFSCLTLFFHCSLDRDLKMAFEGQQSGPTPPAATMLQLSSFYSLGTLTFFQFSLTCASTFAPIVPSAWNIFTLCASFSWFLLTLQISSPL
jgi:hypothetical protein